MEDILSIVKGTTAKLVHVCKGKVVYTIQTENHLYQLELDSNDKEWETTYLLPEYKSITFWREWERGASSRACASGNFA